MGINSLNGQQYEKMHFVFPGNLIYAKPTCTDVTPNAGQTAKEGKKGRNLSNVLSQLCELDSSQPHIQHSRAGYRLTLPRKGQQAPISNSSFHLAVWGHWSCDTDMVLMNLRSSNIFFL